jgi:hypothetical protein
MNNWRKTIFEIVETDRETTASRIYDKIMLRLFGRICNPSEQGKLEELLTLCEKIGR